jgi:DsbC/DsbD-like thiol-disulfide interchange protein
MFSSRSTLSPLVRIGALAALTLTGCAASSANAAPEAPVQAEPERSAWPEAPKPENVVQAQLQTSASGLKPNGKFLLAVLFDITPEYRISWTNPGDVGERTRVTFDAPPGFHVGPVSFPAPKRFELPGHLVNYGYQGKTAVFAEITAPAELSTSQSYRFDVKAHWLACKDDCATEDLEAFFELVAEPSAPEPELPAELAAIHAQLPRAFSELPDSSSEWKGSPDRPALQLSAQDVKWLDFFPGDGEQPKLLLIKPAGAVLNLKFEGGGADKPLRGLAVGELNGEAACFDVDLPWPSKD